jgi:hypothetical protein
MSLKKVLLIGFVALLIHPVVAQEEGCKLKKDTDGIMVYACKSDNAKFKSLKADFTIHHTSINELVALLKDVANYPKWQYNMTSAEILKRESDESIITRSVIDAPWPVENRELIVRYQITHKPERGEVHIEAKTLAYDYPTTKGLLRIPFSHAEWIVQESGSSLKVNYTLHVDPGGSVPAWLVNMGIAEGPYHTFINLKKQLEKT